MNNNNGNETISKKTENKPEGGLGSVLRVATMAVIVIGAVGSLTFMFRAGQQTPRLLLVAFTVWILAPFVVLYWASMGSKPWSALTRIVLYSVAIIVSLGSLAIYSGLVDVKPAGSANAFLFVAVPPVSLVVSVLTMGLARIFSA